jgi:hypothetical protein
MGTEAIDLPKLSAPARRALTGAGYTRLEPRYCLTMPASWASSPAWVRLAQPSLSSIRDT